MSVQNDQAVVLRLSDYSETSQIVSLFTQRHGQVRLIAKGARRGAKKRFVPGLDLLEYGEVSFTPAREAGALGTLTEWRQLDSFSGIRGDLARQYGVYYAAELVSRLTEEYDPHVELFASLLEFLGRSADAGVEPASSVVRFQGMLLKAIGYAPVLRRCVHCGKARVRGTRAYFSSSAGGMICRECETAHAEKIRLSPKMLDEPAAAQEPAEWFDLLDYHLTRIAGREFTTSRRLRQLLGGGGA